MTFTYEELCGNIAEVAAAVRDVGEPVFISRDGEPELVLMSPEVYKTWDGKKRLSSRIAMQEVRFDSMVDAMTGAMNRLAFTERVEKLNAEIGQNTVSSFAVIACDVNGLKTTNDTYGHEAGDALICGACDLISESCGSNLVYRTGGDEFVVIITSRSYERRQEMLGKIRQGINGKSVAAAGMADYIPGKDADFASVLNRADAEMYRNKGDLKRK